MCHKVVAHFILLLNLVEVVNDDTDEEVDDELTSNDHESHKVQTRKVIIVFLRLHVYAGSVHAIVHHALPSFCRHHLEQAHHGIEHVVKIDVLILPGTTSIKTILLCLNGVKYFAFKLLAAEEFAFEHVDSNDGQYQEE